MANNHKLVIIVGSVRDGRFGPVVGSWVAEQARAHGGFDVEVVDLAGIDIPLTCPPNRRSTPGTPTAARPGWPP